MTKPWWEGATPHLSIRDGKVDEALFEAKLGEAVLNRGPAEYRDAELFFQKTFLTAGLRGLLLDALRLLTGERAANPNVNLKTSFGGGKTHTELALYHLFQHPSESMQVPQVRDLVADAGLSAPPACRVAVLPCTRLNPTGRKTEEGLEIRTLWGEVAYLLGGPPAFALVAQCDAERVSPGEEPLEQVLRLAGPSLILIDETLHYVDKVSVLSGTRGDLAKETVAFLRELTSAVDNTPASMLVVSLTASRIDQLSNQAQVWLSSLEEHVNRLARSCTPIEGLEIHEVVRRRLFDKVDDGTALETAQHYHRLYSGMGALPAQYVDLSYCDLMRRSFPFHPELVTVLYERWGAKPGFQLTRDTLRFLALALQDLWQRRQSVTPDLILMGHVPVRESSIRAMVRDIAGDPQWETVMGSDIAAAAPGEQKAKAEIIDEERADGQGLARALATTLLLYSLGGGEHPEATRQDVRLACARQDVEDVVWDDLLDKLRGRLFYLYFEDAHYQFRKEPNVTSLQQTYRLNLKAPEVEAYVQKLMLERALGTTGSPLHRFAQLYYLPTRAVDRDDESLKLVVLGFDEPIENGKPSETAQQLAMGILERHGQVLRQHRNTVLFCAPDQEGVRKARERVADYLGWRKVQLSQDDWDRIGGTQQAIVKDQMEINESAALQAIIQAHSWALVPAQDRVSSGLALRPVALGTYGPGKQIAPMVWDTLTAKTPGAQWVLTTLTADIFLERYNKLAWPESENWVTTAQLWNRFTTNVGLPTLPSDQVLLDMLNQGQYEGKLAIGSLTDAQAPRDQRDSYAHLYFKETMPPNVPVVGDRWLVLRPEVYRTIAEQPEQVTPEDILGAIEALGGGDQPLLVRSVHGYVTKGRRIDEATFRQALDGVIQARSYTYRLDAETLTELPSTEERILEGTLVREHRPPEPPKPGRTITIQGPLESIGAIGSFYKNILQPLASQKPATLTIEVKVEAQFDQDPGGGLNAALDDAFDKNAFPGLTMKDSKSG